MMTGANWALLSPVGNFHKLCEPNFFVGREDHMDLTLKVGYHSLCRQIWPNRAVSFETNAEKKCSVHFLNDLYPTVMERFFSCSLY